MKLNSEEDKEKLNHVKALVRRVSQAPDAQACGPLK